MVGEKRRFAATTRNQAGSGVDVLEFPASVARLDTGLADVAEEEEEEKRRARGQEMSVVVAHVSRRKCTKRRSVPSHPVRG